MIDAATAQLLRSRPAPPTLTDGQIKAELIFYEMEEDRFFLEFPDVAAAHRRTLLGKVPTMDCSPRIEFEEEEILQAA